MLLISFDLLKAIFLLTFPVTVESHPSTFYNEKFFIMWAFSPHYQLKVLTSTIIFHALHTVLLVSNSARNIKRGFNYQGGLFRYRYLVHIASIFLPLILVSLAFIHSKGYVQLTNICYLPARPISYRLVLSWIPRYIIIISIFIIYGYIYHNFKKNFNELETSRSDVYGIKKKKPLSRIYEAVGVILFANVTLSNDLDNNENLTAKESANTQLSGLT